MANAPSLKCVGARQSEETRAYAKLIYKKKKPKKNKQKIKEIELTDFYLFINIYFNKNSLGVYESILRHSVNEPLVV